MFHISRLLILIAASLAAGFAAAEELASRPPMGWNSWDAYGLRITERQFRDNVEVLAKDLKPFGWTYAVIDEGWFMENPEDRPTPEKLRYAFDSNGRYMPAPERFPSALSDGRNTGFTALGAYVHGQGLKFGIHIVRGIPRPSVADDAPIAGSPYHTREAADTADACPWDPTNWGVEDNAAGQAWYDSLIAQYAAWGVDFLKVDCISDHPHKAAEIAMIHRAIEKSGRAMVLSLSPGPTSPDLAGKLPEVAQMWRISDDVWDLWGNPQTWPRALKQHFDVIAGWAPFAHAGSWPDADMLPLGYLGPSPDVGSARPTRLTRDEQRSMVTLWAMARSPLIVGANLTQLDAWTRSLLTNREVLDIDQSSSQGRRAAQDVQISAWTAKGPDDGFYLALFNLSDEPAKVANGFGFYDLPPGMYRMRDLWSGMDLPPATAVGATVPAHGVMLYRLAR